VIEQYLWKISGLYIAGFGLLFMAGSVLYEAIFNLESGRVRQDNVTHLRWLGIRYDVDAILTALRLLLLGLNFIIWGIYVVCKTFIIVECFLDVFHLRDSAFEVPLWSQYFPHIS
jgi:hypothetical protein